MADDEPFDGKLDIGGGHRLRFTSLEWDEEALEMNPRYRPLIAQFGPGPHPYGLIDFHDDLEHPGKRHGGGVVFDTEIVRAYHAIVDEADRAAGREPQRHVLWQLVSLDPIHVEPSLLCGCGDHGFIHGGRWVTA